MRDLLREPSWRLVLEGEFGKPYFSGLQTFISAELGKAKVCMHATCEGLGKAKVCMHATCEGLGKAKVCMHAACVMHASYHLLTCMQLVSCTQRVVAGQGKGVHAPSGHGHANAMEALWR